ncbi:ABC transporter substrate-binding protein [Niallia endozanthoxylica]|uniref:ABC transporter substrate-binding protein n=2 Tax=Niallia endozanthoxylica TaxID=2036016 RepID=A0A5J5HZ16_9BACI|nr:ABC transporter substrate-binding protein [Niallia endozanthoxylica]KAA9027499.1 ABC transporter substrate-binding protein [Niallia endozanthoxylica]
MLMKKKTSMSLAALGLMGALFLSGCGASESNDGNEGSDSKDTFKVGITQYVTHPSLDAATEGFKKALKDEGLTVEYDEQNANADQSNVQNIATNLAGDGVDLIFANATPSAQAALNATKDIPIVFTSVTDAVGAQLVKSMEEPGGNVTGTIDNHPDAIPNTVKFISENFPDKTIGTVYNAGEQNSVAQVDTIKESIKELGLNELETATVSTSAEVKQAAESLIGKADVIYIITDNTVVSALESVIQVAGDNELPLFVGELDSVERGGFAAYGFNYEDIGYEAGLLAAQILKGEKKPSELPVQYPQNLKLVINKNAAKEMNVELKDEWNEQAEFIE